MSTNEQKEAEMVEVTKRIFGDTQVQVKYTPSQGRYVITHRDLKTAEIVLTSDPYTTIVNEVSIRNVCADCFTFKGNEIDHDEHCGKCNEAWYCNETCKKAHLASIHHLECEYMDAVRKLTLSNKFAKAKLRSLIRLLIKEFLEKDAENAAKKTGKPKPEIFGPKFIDVESLIAHNEENEDQDEAIEILKALKAIVDPKYIQGHSDDFIYLLMSRSECNQFGLWSPDDELLGLSLHPSASFFNHSCIPNCYSEWSGINLVFRALYPVPAGSELTISYIDAHSSTRQRREELTNAYYFTCICNRCTNNGAHVKARYDAFYKRYLKCPKGPGLMRLDTYQGEEDEPKKANGVSSADSSPVIGDANVTTDEETSRSGEESVSKEKRKKKKKKKRSKRNHHTVDGFPLPKKIPYGYEIRSCMTCSVARCSPAVPSVTDYLELFHIYEAEELARLAEE